MPTPRKYENDAERQRAFRARREAARLQQLAEKNLPAMPLILSIPGTVRWMAMHEQALTLLRSMTDEMASYYADRSEEWQEGERGQAFVERQEAVDEALSALEALSLQ